MSERENGESQEKPAWARGNLTIPRALLARVEEEAAAAYGRDEEACGALVGPSAEPLVLSDILPMENRANKLHKLDPETYPRTGRMYFDLDPLKFERRVREGRTNGLPVKVLYHSHLDVGAYFSDTDAAAAKMGGDAPAYELAYLVTSVRSAPTGAVVDDHKLFIWDEARRAFVESRLLIRDADALRK